MEHVDTALFQQSIWNWIGDDDSDVFSASVTGQMYCRREPRWMSPRPRHDRMTVFSVRLHRSDDPGIRIGKCYCNHIGTPTFSHPTNPLTSGIRSLSSCLAKNGLGTVDHQGAMIAIAALADPKQPDLPAAGSLFWNKPKPDGRLMALSEA